DLDGTIAFSDQSGAPTVVDTENGTSSSFSYRVAATSSTRLRTSSAGSLRVGSLRLTASRADSEVPVAFLVFSFQLAGITVTAAGVAPAGAAAASRLFVEASGQFAVGEIGSLQTAIAISNPDSSAPAQVSLELKRLDGATTAFRGTLTIPAGGQ